jgi:asparagine synthase (glutamine-hydrolysing)
MCGINGFVSAASPVIRREEIVAKMNDDLAHRGPDSQGLWSGGEVTLGHRRLSIIDLSENCNQPFYSVDGRYVMVYNGELYNFRELKLELQRAEHGKDTSPVFFKTQSDTEVVLAAYIRWGAKCLDRFNGMYAFAIYDTVTSKLFIGRDRLGVKPLYYFFGNEGLPDP